MKFSIARVIQAILSIAVIPLAFYFSGVTLLATIYRSSPLPMWIWMVSTIGLTVALWVVIWKFPRQKKQTINKEGSVG